MAAKPKVTKPIEAVERRLLANIFEKTAEFESLSLQLEAALAAKKFGVAVVLQLEKDKLFDILRSAHQRDAFYE